MLTGRKPDLSKMCIFGSTCYAYKHNHKKLGSRCERGIFVGYSRNIPAYLVYNPDTEKVTKHRLVQFIKRNNQEQSTQTEEYEPEMQIYDSQCENVRGTEVPQQGSNEEVGMSKKDPNQISNDSTISHQKENGGLTGSETNQDQNQRYPKRSRREPKYLQDYVIDNDECDITSTSVDCFYRAVCGVPQTFREATLSPEALGWRRAMEKEINSLKENDTFELTTLPQGRKAVGGKWVYAIKENNEEGKILKARYVAKGYN